MMNFLAIGQADNIWKLSRNEKNKIALLAAAFAKSDVRNVPLTRISPQQRVTAFSANDAGLLDVPGSPMDVDDERLVVAPNPLSTRLWDYTLRNKLGQGAFGEVYRAESSDGRGGYTSFALKVVRRASLTSEMTKSTVYTEQKIMKALTRMGSPYFPKLRESFMDGYNMYFAMEMIPGGTLRDVMARNRGRLTNTHIQFIMAELIYAVRLMHDNDMIHRDLKPENVLIDEHGHLVLADFGLARYFDGTATKASGLDCCPSQDVETEQITQTECGTLGYMAPEMLQGDCYAFEVDMWSVGCIAYELALGRAPFHARDKNEHVMRVMRDEPAFPEDCRVEPSLQDLISRLLSKSQHDRMTASEAFGHEFFCGIDWERVARKAYNVHQRWASKPRHPTDRSIDKQILVDDRLAYQAWDVSLHDRNFIMLPDEVAAVWNSSATTAPPASLGQPESAPLLAPTAHRLSVGRQVIDVLEKACRARERGEYASVILNSLSAEQLLPGDLGVLDHSHSRFSIHDSVYVRLLGRTPTYPDMARSQDEMSSTGHAASSLFDQSSVRVEGYVPLASSIGPAERLISDTLCDATPVVQSGESDNSSSSLRMLPSLYSDAFALPRLALSTLSIPASPEPLTPTSQQALVNVDVEDPFADPVYESDVGKGDPEWLGELSMDISEMQSWYGEMSMDISDSDIVRHPFIVVHSEWRAVSRTG